MTFLCSLANRIGKDPTSYTVTRAFVSDGTRVHVFALDGDVLGAGQDEADIVRLVGTEGAEGALLRLWERNGTTTTFSKPVKVTAESPEQAAARLNEDR